MLLMAPKSAAPPIVPSALASSVGQNRCSKAARCPPAADCQTLVMKDGRIRIAAASAGGMTRLKRPIAAVGRPMPTTPLMAPASRKTPMIAASKTKFALMARPCAPGHRGTMRKIASLPSIVTKAWL